MAPIEGVIQVQGDITNARTAEVVWFIHYFIMFYLFLQQMVRFYFACVYLNSI